MKRGRNANIDYIYVYMRARAGAIIVPYLSTRVCYDEKKLASHRQLNRYLYTRLAHPNFFFEILIRMHSFEGRLYEFSFWNDRVFIKNYQLNSFFLINYLPIFFPNSTVQV